MNQSPTRPILPVDATTPAAAAKQARFHDAVVAEVAAAITAHDIVVVGMGWNPHVGSARKALTEAGHTHHYLQYGNYASQWKERLAIKMWSGWPTFPQVFVKGRLVGGSDDLRAAIADGSLAALLEG